MIRVSVTTLDAYRLYMQTDWMTLQKLEDQILRREPPTEVMVRGRAFHAICEDSKACFRGDCYEAEGFSFDAASMDEFLESLPTDGAAECKETFEFPAAGIRLVGKCDYLSGYTAYEWKTKDRAFTPADYADSLQWKCYSMLFTVPQVVYRMVRLKKQDDIWHVIEHDDMTLHRYRGMEAELSTWVTAFGAFLRERGLHKHLEEK